VHDLGRVVMSSNTDIPSTSSIDSSIAAAGIRAQHMLAGDGSDDVQATAQGARSRDP
jgi:hypothetical protein